MPASFNAIGEDRLPPVVPETDELIAKAVVRTTEEETAFRRSELAAPGTDGAMSTSNGLEPADVIWSLHLEAYSLAALKTFEDKFAAYRTGRYRLLSETGIQWDKVEFRVYEPLDLHWVGGQDPQGRPKNHPLRIARVRFRYVQPLYFVEAPPPEDARSRTWGAKAAANCSGSGN